MSGTLIYFSAFGIHSLLGDYSYFPILPSLNALHLIPVCSDLAPLPMLSLIDVSDDPASRLLSIYSPLLVTVWNFCILHYYH